MSSGASRWYRARSTLSAATIRTAAAMASSACGPLIRIGRQAVDGADGAGPYTAGAGANEARPPMKPGLTDTSGTACSGCASGRFVWASYSLARRSWLTHRRSCRYFTAPCWYQNRHSEVSSVTGPATLNRTM